MRSPPGNRQTFDKEAIDVSGPTRALALTILVIGLVSAVGPARAQTYDPNYPVCLQVYDIGGGYIDFSYTSLPQCNTSASGHPAQCITNPYFTRSTKKQVGGMRYR
jgi:Protein of unknown function (DUF3551)